MDQLCSTVEYLGTQQDYARVVNKSGTLYSVETTDGIFQVNRAVSCLVEPLADDIVLIVKKDFDNGYILAVLERQSSEKTVLQVQGDIEIRSEQGRVDIHGSDGMSLASLKDINITSDEFTVAAATGTAAINNMTFLGAVFEAQIDKIKTLAENIELFEAQIDKIKTLAENIELFVKSIFQKSSQSRKIVDQIDYVKSRQISYEAEKTLQLRGAFSQMTAKEDIHIDGERINIG